jgi:hypothetical protein
MFQKIRGAIGSECRSRTDSHVALAGGEIWISAAGSDLPFFFFRERDRDCSRLRARLVVFANDSLSLNRL